MTLTPEHSAYQKLQLWEPISEILSAEVVFEQEHQFKPLFLFLYQKLQEAYKKFPRRRDGTNSFIHPFNVVLDLQKAEISDGITICAGLLHDYIEDSVDLYQKENNFQGSPEQIALLDN